MKAVENQPFMSLPIAAALPELHAALAQHPAVVLEAPPGAGKTTGIPPALLSAAWLAGRAILMLEPRRLTARAAAARIAAELGESVGGTVGYRVRFDSVVSKRTRIEVVTEGILTRRLQQDPELDGVGLVIFDEFHERNLHADLALALCQEVRQALREDLKLLVMSATLDGVAVAELLGGAPVVRSAGRSFPVDMRYAPPSAGGRIAEDMAAALVHILPETEGDVLAFLPGGGEIQRVRGLLEDRGVPANLQVIPLYGDLARAEQDAAIRPSAPGRRKLVLATNIAETSLTIEGVTTVVDSGWRRAPRFDPGRGLGRLELERISQASAAQRAGRAGRLQAGTCYRLWSTEQQARLLAYTPPEIQHADLLPLALELAVWGVHDAAELAWLEPLPAPALAQAQELLQNLGALDPAGRITAMGRAMAEWPLHPRLAHMLVKAEAVGWNALACDLSALLEERDPLRGGSDLHTRLHLLDAFRHEGAEAARQAGVDPEWCARVVRSAKHLRGRFTHRPPSKTSGVSPDPAPLLAWAYPDRIAQRRAGSDTRYRLSNGGGALLDESDSLRGQDWLVVAEVRSARQGEPRITQALPTTLAALETYLPERFTQADNIAWDNRQQTVTARRESRLGALVIRNEPLAGADPDVCRGLLLEGIRRAGADALPWDPAARTWQARLLCAREWFPEQDWPDVSDTHLLTTLEDWLAPYLTPDMRRLDQLRNLDLAQILSQQLDWPHRQALDKLTPPHLEVPSGSRIALEYRPGAAPILAVRLQEVFGWQETPRIAAGRIALMLHLLSPARRPVQVTQDLANFWRTTYAEVKKELKGRYPKHYWPDDPFSAVARRGTKRKPSV